MNLLKIYILFLLLGMFSISTAQQWTHVGPISTNLEPVNGKPNLFETGQTNLIEFNPDNTNHLFCGGRFAGLWESTNGGQNWTRISTQHLGSNGIGKILFLNTDEIFVSNLHVIVGGVKKQYSMSSGIFNFSKKTWTVVKPFTEKQHMIHDAFALTIEKRQHIIIASSVGVFGTSDRGKTWALISDSPTQSIRALYNEKNVPVKLLFAGTNALSGNPELHVCDVKNWSNSEINQMQSLTLPLYDNSRIRSNNQTLLNAKNADCLIELGEIRSLSDFDLFLLSDQDLKYSRKSGPDIKIGNSSHLMLYKVTFKNNEFSEPLVIDHDTHLGQSILSGARTGLAYDSELKGIWYSGVKLHFAFDPSVSNRKFHGIRQGFKTGKGIIHDDIHELRILHQEDKRFLLAACDGGIARTKLPNGIEPSSFNPNVDVSFEGLNNGLHVMLVTGFSGASQDPNFFVIGGFDITNTDFFRADQGRNEHTELTWENAGGLIDLFDNSRILITVSLYNQFYRLVHIDSNRIYNVSENRTFYAPIEPGVAPIRADKTKLSNNHNEVIGFQRRNFIQDPFRPGRIFYVKHKVGLHQLDMVSGLFVRKLDMAELNPELEWAGWSNDWRWWRSVSFSPQTSNSMHIIVNGSDNPENRIQNPMVIKYIGRDLDACFGLDFTRIGKGGAQWRLISERLFKQFNKIMGTMLSTEEILEIDLIDIETSPTNSNRVYVLMRSKSHPSVKIVVFDGRKWQNYGVNLPADEYPLAMIMDYRTADGIYLATDKNIYYREQTMTEWINYSGNYPMLNSEQLEINYKENTLRVGTFGLGIWKTPLFSF